MHSVHPMRPKIIAVAIQERANHIYFSCWRSTASNSKTRDKEIIDFDTSAIMRIQACNIAYIDIENRLTYCTYIITSRAHVQMQPVCAVQN